MVLGENTFHLQKRPHRPSREIPSSEICARMSERGKRVTGTRDVQKRTVVLFEIRRQRTTPLPLLPPPSPACLPPPPPATLPCTSSLSITHPRLRFHSATTMVRWVSAQRPSSP